MFFCPCRYFILPVRFPATRPRNPDFLASIPRDPCLDVLGCDHRQGSYSMSATRTEQGAPKEFFFRVASPFYRPNRRPGRGIVANFQLSNKASGKKFSGMPRGWLRPRPRANHGRYYVGSAGGRQGQDDFFRFCPREPAMIPFPFCFTPVTGRSQKGKGLILRKVQALQNP